ncbi:MAG: hypothetical protein Q8L66_14500 [Caulobacter sp.]|nr:hypothetical protein [Caulobacter sp.]
MRLSVLFRSLLAIGILAGPSPSLAAARETWIPVYVGSYYAAADSRRGQPTVKVGEAFDALLQSNRPKDVLAARDLIVADPDYITPMTLMVLSIRLYDVGLRDDSVFWFYVAKYRAVTLMDTATFLSGPFSDGIVDAIGGFITLAGPYINGYAFCDVDKQMESNARAIDWVDAHPYQTIFSPLLASRLKDGDVNENLRVSVEGIRKAVATERAQLTDPATVASVRASRKANGADARYCWAS